MKKVPLFIMLLLGLSGYSQVSPPPTANDVSIATCDDDGVNDGLKAYNLTLLNPQILGSQNPATYTVNFYSDAALTKPINNPQSSTLYHTYAQVVNTSDGQMSPAADVFVTVVAQPTPTINAAAICTDPKTGTKTDSYIVSGYGGTFKDVNGVSQPMYFFKWTDSTGTVVSQDPNLSTNIPGNYTLEITTNTPEACTSGVVPFTVNESALPSKISYSTSGGFSDSQTIVITTESYIGDGSNFLYSLDGSTPQMSSKFDDVKPGPHEVTVYDTLGCGSTSTPIDIQLVNNPKFFTPNGDGYNDRFAIKGLEGQENMLIYIFDRHGKLITQITGDSEGWDGNFNGVPAPANDYWFTVTYTENGERREYKSHFSLKR